MILGTAKRVKEESKSEPTRTFSDKQEKSVVKATGGKQVANSGAGWMKGDVLTSKDGITKGKNNFLLECKTKTKSSDSITIQKSWFEKNREECLVTGTPHQAVVFNFGPGEENHYIIDEYLFQALQEYLNNLDETL